MTHSINFKATDELLALFTAQQADGVESPLASIKVLDDPLGVLRADRRPSSVEGR